MKKSYQELRIIYFKFFHINHCSIKFCILSMNSQNTTFMMIGSSNKKQPMQYKGKKSNCGLEGVLADFRLFHDKKLANHQDKFYLQSSNHNKAGVHSMEDIKLWLKNKFIGAKQSNKQYLVIFYSGHGHQHTGNLAIDTIEEPNGDNLSLQDVINIFKKNSQNLKLFLILDSCYSGAWCYKISSLKQYQSVSVFAVCQSNQKAEDTNEGGCLFNCLFGQAQKFEENYQKIMKKHRPVFLNNTKFPTALKKQHFKILNEDIYNLSKVLSLEETEDKYELAPGATNQGIIWYKNKDVYQGTWNSQKKPHGYGKYKYNSREEYEGSWENGKYHGHGGLKLLGGFTYVGDWKNGKLDGEGYLKLTISEKNKPNQPNKQKLQELNFRRDLNFKQGIHIQSGQIRYE